MGLIESLIYWQMYNLYTTGAGFLFVAVILSWCVIKIRRLDNIEE